MPDYFWPQLFHYHSITPCDALDGAGRGPDEMRMGKAPGADERFGAWRSSTVWAATTTPTSSI
jgi:hypothetical protein